MLSHQSPSGAAKTGCVASPNACAGRFVRLRRRSTAGRQDRLSDRDVGGGNESAGDHHAEPHYVSASHSHGPSKPDWYSYGGTHRYGSPDEDPHGYCHHNIDADLHVHRDEDRYGYSDSNTDADLDSHHYEDRHCYSDSNNDADFDPNCDEDQDCYADSNHDADFDPNCDEDRDCYADSHSLRYSNSYRAPVADTHLQRNPHASR